VRRSIDNLELVIIWCPVVVALLYGIFGRFKCVMRSSEQMPQRISGGMKMTESLWLLLLGRILRAVRFVIGHFVCTFG